MRAEEVHLVTGDGVELWAWYVESRNGHAVVLRHGSGSTATAMLEHAAVLASHGYGVLVMDARGHGNSGGRAMDFGWYGDSDVSAGVSFLLAQPATDPQGVAVLGMSMGGEEALGSLATDQRIVAAVAEGVTARTAEDKSWFDDVYGWRGAIQIGLEQIQFEFADLLTAAQEPIALADAARAASPRPILLIAGGAVAEESHAAEHIREDSPGNVTIWTVPGAGHIEGHEQAPEAWEETVLAFLERAFSSS
jgi:fermentation-respiration switch protein FrsA (DUF1100 family)